MTLIKKNVKVKLYKYKIKTSAHICSINISLTASLKSVCDVRMLPPGVDIGTTLRQCRLSSLAQPMRRLDVSFAVICQKTEIVLTEHF